MCSANHRAGYFSNLACDWLSTVWDYSELKTGKAFITTKHNNAITVCLFLGMYFTPTCCVKRVRFVLSVSGVSIDGGCWSGDLLTFIFSNAGLCLRDDIQITCVWKWIIWFINWWYKWLPFLWLYIISYAVMVHLLDDIKRYFFPRADLEGAHRAPPPP